MGSADVGSYSVVLRLEANVRRPNIWPSVR